MANIAMADVSPGIKSGFPVRRCSWSQAPIVSSALTRNMIRWLDSVCTRQAVLRERSGNSETGKEGKGGADGTGNQDGHHLDKR
jgi:hypothetical protein